MIELFIESFKRASKIVCRTHYVDPMSIVVYTVVTVVSQEVHTNISRCLSEKILRILGGLVRNRETIKKISELKIIQHKSV
jgi:ribosomal protein S2